jgi:hypothetical protein
VPASPGLSTARTRCGSIVTASSSISHTTTRRRQCRVERNMVRNGSSDDITVDPQCLQLGQSQSLKLCTSSVAATSTRNHT